ncbi:hypothetical protein GTZ85_44120 [Streptomyces sp. SID5474]|nr:hypothetical protein [Streptomyces sp. SID5474]
MWLPSAGCDACLPKGRDRRAPVPRYHPSWPRAARYGNRAGAGTTHSSARGPVLRADPGSDRPFLRRLRGDLHVAHTSGLTPSPDR